MQNNVQDLNNILKPLARSLLIQHISKKNANKLDQELYYIKNEIKVI